MRFLTVILLCLVFLVSPVLADEKIEFKDPEDTVSYSVGYQIGADFRKNDIAVDPDMVAAGVRDALQGNTPRLSEESMRVHLSDLQKRMTEARQKLLQEQAEKNLAAGETFLAENAKKQGVVTLPSGLQYQVMQEGEGSPPRTNDTVTVHYRGTLIDGTEFDSSYTRGQPASFRADRVIKGWTEALQLMKPGAKWKLFIPARLAYGERGAGSRIAPNSTLIFEVELLSVGAPQESKANEGDAAPKQSTTDSPAGKGGRNPGAGSGS